jgi:hypothetical protein
VAARIAIGALLLGAVAVGVAWGPGALGVYLFFVAIAGVVSLALNVGGDWLTKSSRGRFDDHRR